MKLVSIKTAACPVCGETEIVAESVKTHRDEIMEHAHGGKWESREFLCGYEAEYIPNFREDERKSRCRRDPAIAERKEKREAAMNATIAFVTTLNDIDDDYRSALYEGIQSTKWRL